MINKNEINPYGTQILEMQKIKGEPSLMGMWVC